MFVGAVPKPAVEQIVRIVPFDQWKNVFVGCSGSFRFDKAVKDRFPSVNVYSNDVSLLTVGLGKLLVGEDMPVKFIERLAFVEQLVEGCPFEVRMAAVLVALEMARYAGNNTFSQTHFKHYADNFDVYLKGAIDKLAKFTEEVHIDGFFAGDFRLQAARALEQGGGVATFAPTYKNGYERLYKFVHANIEWPAPSYDVWDPKQLGDWLTELDRNRLNYCVISDHLIEGFEPVTVFRTATHKPVYAFARTEKSSYRRATYTVTPFRYTPAVASELTIDTPVALVRADAGQMAFLKDKYLSKGIAHVSGDLNYLVLLGGKLAGGFIQTRSKWGGVSDIYMLSDFSLVRERRVSKLIAMLATCRDVTAQAERKFVIRVEWIFTTAFTDKPVSMKYRGIYELHSRKPGFLNYKSRPRNGTPQEVYREWFQRFAAGKD